MSGKFKIMLGGETDLNMGYTVLASLKFCPSLETIHKLRAGWRSQIGTLFDHWEDIFDFNFTAFFYIVSCCFTQLRKLRVWEVFASF